jgi:hypothetical protein
MKFWFCRGVLLLAAVAAFGCGDVQPGDDDAAPPAIDAQTIDAPIYDAGPDPSDAAPDAAPPIQGGPPNTEVTTGGGRLSGSVYQMDVQLGHGFGQAPSTGGGKTTEGAAAIKP